MDSLYAEFKSLYDVLLKKTGTILQEKPVQSLVATYPALLVAMSDGTFDKEERGYLAEICTSLVPDEVTDEREKLLMACELYSVSCFLLSNEDEWKSKIFSLIKHQIQESPSDKPVLEEMMTGMAEASGGISDIERKTMDEIRKVIFF